MFGPSASRNVGAAMTAVPAIIIMYVSFFAVNAVTAGVRMKISSGLKLTKNS